MHSSSYFRELSDIAHRFEIAQPDHRTALRVLSVVRATEKPKERSYGMHIPTN
jgi:hypothetical protein